MIFDFQKNASLPKSNQKGDHKRTRNICVTVRMSEEEKLQMERNFRDSFVESKQAYLIGAILGKPVPTKGMVLNSKRYLEKLDEILVQVRGIATNVNQLTRHAHTDKEIESVAELDTIAAELTDVLDNLITDIQQPLHELPHARKEVQTEKEKKKKAEREKRIAEKKARIAAEKEKEARLNEDGNT